MAKKSSQKFISRNRAPRVQIEYDVELYGAEHLLRLFVKLPELLAQCKMQREHMQVLVSKLMELLKFIQANKAKYFVTQYESATDEYLAWWGNE